MMTALYIIAGVIILLVILSLVRINAVISTGYSDKSGYGEIYIKYLFFRYNILPVEEKAVKEEDEETEETGEKQEEEPKKKKLTICQIYKIIKAISADSQELLKFIERKSITIKNIDIEMQIGLSQPHYTGMALGGAYSFIYGILGTMDKEMNLKRFSVRINPEWNRERISGGLYTVIYTNIINILRICFRVAKIFLKVRKMQKEL